MFHKNKKKSGSYWTFNMLTVFFRSLTAATATAIAIVAPIRIINRPVGNHGTTLSTPMEGSCSKVLLLK
jgi:hypothetical protein